MEADIKLKNNNAIFELFPLALAAFKKKLIDPFIRDSSKREVIKSPRIKFELFTFEQQKKISNYISEQPLSITTDQLYKRLLANEKVLHEVNDVLQGTLTNPGSLNRLKWLTNNFSGVIKQIDIEKEHCLKAFADGKFQRTKFSRAELSRGYNVAVEIIAHCGGHIDLNNLFRFTIANQINTFLEPGKLWVFPILLRLALIENLCRLMIQAAIDLGNEMSADNLVEQFITAKGNPRKLQLVMAELSALEPSITDSILVTLSKRAGEKGRNISPSINWLKQKAIKRRITIDELTEEVNKKERGSQFLIIQHTNSLIFLSSIDWNEFIENNCLDEQLRLRDFKGMIPSNVSLDQRSLYL